MESVSHDKSTAFWQNRQLQCAGNILNLSRPLLMGIINLTPDSFYKGSRFQQIDECLSEAENMIAEGAAIIDLGAVSSRPGAMLADEKEELRRLLPVLELLVKRYPHTVFSIDTFRGAVAKACYESGAGIINDISGGKFDDTLIKEAGRSGLPYVLMHMQGTPQTMQQSPHYHDVVQELKNYFETLLPKLHEAGISQIILDPGFGFGKTMEHNYALLSHLDQFKAFNLPLLVGISRKSMIYKLLNITPDEALNGTTALHMTALINGADILRVHDVKQAAEVLKLFEALQ